MKKIIGFLVLLCLTLFSLSCTAFCDDGVIINEENFPDSVFRKKIYDIYGCSEGETISQEKLNYLVSVNFAKKGITNLKGIEHFKSLERLDISDNEGLTELDVSKNTYLNYLNFENTKITTLNCSNTDLTELDLTALPDLKSLTCQNTSISNLDFSNNTALEFLDCNNNASLITLNCAKTKISKLDISNCPALQNLECFNTNISKLDISNNTALQSLNCNNTNINELNVANNTALTHLMCIDTAINKLDVTKNIALQELDCRNTKISELNVANNIALEYLICNNTNISELDVANNIALQSLICNNTNISKLNVTNNTALKHLECDNTSISNLDISNNTALQELYCGDTAISNLDVSNNTALVFLDCTNTAISNLDVSNNTALQELYCDNTNISELDLSKNTALSNFEGSSSLKQPLSYNADNTLYLDLSRLVTDKTRIKNVVGGNYDEATGIVSFDKDITSPSVSYEYETGYKDTVLPVTVNLVELTLNESCFPDSSFRAYIAHCLKKSEGDTLSQADLNEIINIDISETEVTNLKGIEYFSNLKILNCSNTAINSLDVSNNTALQELYCYNTAISKLDLTNNTALQTLYCSNTAISELNLTNNTALQALYCHNTAINELNLTNNTALQALYCYNTAISVLDVSNNTALQALNCSDTAISVLDVSNNIALQALNCSNTKLKALDLSKNTALTSFVDSSNIEEVVDFNGENLFYVDLSKIVTDITKISKVVGGIYDQTTGIVTLDAINPLGHFSYYYLTGNGDYTLTVTVKIIQEKEVLTENSFVISPATDFVYDGKAKDITVTTDLTDIGEYTVYFVNQNNEKCDAIKEIGLYNAVVSVEGNDKYYPIKLYYEIIISPRELTIKADNQSIVYGDTINSLTYQITSGSLLEGDKLEGELEICEVPFSSSNNYSKGEYIGAITQGNLYIVNDNYIISFENGDLSVAPKAVEIEWLGEDTFEFDNTVKKVSAVCKNIIEGDTVGLIFDGATEATEVGEYTAYVTGIDNDNYVISDDAIKIKKWSITKADTSPDVPNDPNTPITYEFMLGDVNLDGEITTKDATEIISEILRKNTDKYITNDTDYLKIADVNGDGELTPKDATEIIKDVLKSEADKVLKHTIITVSKDLKATKK